MSLLISLLILCIIIAFLYWIATLISPMMPPPLRQVPIILVAIIGLILLLNMLGVAGQPFIRIR